MNLPSTPRISGLPGIQILQNSVLSVVNGGMVTLNGESTIENFGQINIGTGGLGGILNAATTQNNSSINFNLTNTVTLTAAISGSGAVTKLGSGTAILGGDNSYSGGTTVSDGALQLGNGGTTGSIVGDVTDNGILAFDRSDVLTFGGVISGTGSAQQNGPGTTVLLADNSYAGGTIINAGTLQLGNGGTTGSIVGNVIDNGILIFDRSNVLTFGGVISGTGSVQQNGTGTTVLLADNTYTGGTSISAGTLQLGTGARPEATSASHLQMCKPPI